MIFNVDQRSCQWAPLLPFCCLLCVHTRWAPRVGADSQCRRWLRQRKPRPCSRCSAYRLTPSIIITQIHIRQATRVGAKRRERKGDMFGCQGYQARRGGNTERGRPQAERHQAEASGERGPHQVNSGMPQSMGGLAWSLGVPRAIEARLLSNSPRVEESLDKAPPCSAKLNI